MDTDADTSEGAAAGDDAGRAGAPVLRWHCAWCAPRPDGAADVTSGICAPCLERELASLPGRTPEEPPGEGGAPSLSVALDCPRRPPLHHSLPRRGRRGGPP